MPTAGCRLGHATVLTLTCCFSSPMHPRVARAARGWRGLPMAVLVSACSGGGGLGGARGAERAAVQHARQVDAGALRAHERCRCIDTPDARLQGCQLLLAGQVHLEQKRVRAASLQASNAVSADSYSSDRRLN